MPIELLADGLKDGVGRRKRLALDELRLDDIVVGAGLRVGRIAISAPRARLVRDAEGRLSAAGLRLVSNDAVAGAAPAAAPAPGPAPGPAPAPTLAWPSLRPGRAD